MDDAVRRMCDGDGDAFRLVYRAVQPALLRYLTVLVGPEEAEDVASDTWAQACRDLDRFRGDADGFRGWVTTIGRHRALDLLRRRGRRVRVVQDLEDVDVVDPYDVESTVVEAFSTSGVVGPDRQPPAAAGRGGLAAGGDGPGRQDGGRRDGGATRRRTVRGVARTRGPWRVDWSPAATFCPRSVTFRASPALRE